MTDAKTEIENIQGFRAVTVTLDDGSPCEVKIKKLNVYELQTYALVYGLQDKVVELFISKEREFVEHLPYEEVEKILDIGHEINNPILTRFSQRDGKMTEFLIKVLTEKVEVKRKLASDLDTSSSKSPSLPDKAQPT